MPGAPVRGTLKQGQFEVLVPGLLGEVGDDQAPRRRPSVGVASRTAPHDISAAFVISARVRSANRFSRPSGAPTGMIANGSAASPATSLATGSGSAASCSAVTAIWRAESKPPAICSTYSSVRSASSSARTCSASALLDDEWLPPVGAALGEDYNPRDHIRKIATYQHGLWLPLTETKRRGHLIASLEKPDHVATADHDGDTPSRPMDRLTAPEFTAERQPVTHPVLRRLMATLTDIEQEIVWAKHHDGARTWADAATMCGRPIREGETVRRKFLKLKNAELQRRSA